MYYKVLVLFLTAVTLMCNLRPALAGILVPSADLERPESGIILNLGNAGNSIFFRNQRRRRAVATMVATHVKEAGGEWEAFNNEAYNRSLPIPSTQALGGFLASMLDILNGDFAFAEKDSSSTILPVPDGYVSAKYRVSVFGTFSNWNEDPGQMTPFEQQAFAYSLAENYIFEVLIPALLIKVGDELDEMPNGAAAKDALAKSQLEVATALAKQLYAIYAWLIDTQTQAKLRTGDYRGFFGDMLKKLYNDGFVDIMTKAVLASAKDIVNPDIKTVIADGLNSILGDLGSIDKLLEFINVLGSFVDMHRARLVEAWEVQVTPRSVVVIPGRKVVTAYTRRSKITIKLKDNGVTSKDAPFRLNLSTSKKLVQLLAPESNTWTFDVAHEQTEGQAEVTVGISPWLTTGTDTLSISAYDWDPDSGAQTLVDKIDVAVEVLDTQPNVSLGGFVYQDCYDKDRDDMWRVVWSVREDANQVPCYYDLDETCKECKEDASPYGNTWFRYQKYGCSTQTPPVTCDANLNSTLGEQHICFLAMSWFSLGDWSWMETQSYLLMPNNGSTCYEYFGPTPRCQQIMHLCE